jgi:hypothetical protein
MNNKGVKVLKKCENKMTGIRVELTQKMTMAGKIIHAVVITNMRTGKHDRIYVHNTLGYAFKRYKAAISWEVVA